MVKTKLLDFADMPIQLAAKKIASMSRKDEYSYVVTPNIDHLSRICGVDGDIKLLEIYRQANLVLCDSRILQKILRLAKKNLEFVVAGSDLTAFLFANVISDKDRVLIVGGESSDIEHLRKLYPNLNLEHINPSMGFINKEDEVGNLIKKIASINAYYIFLAVGSPQQEMLASKLNSVNSLSGVALCVGASINFLLGVEKRAPKIMQTLHLEWFYRILQDPFRLFRRYFGNALKLPKIYSSL